MANENSGTLKDKVAIITGGSRGLGRNTAVDLARRGVRAISKPEGIRHALPSQR